MEAIYPEASTRKRIAQELKVSNDRVQVASSLLFYSQISVHYHAQCRNHGGGKGAGAPQ